MNWLRGLRCLFRPCHKIIDARVCGIEYWHCAYCENDNYRDF